jgi:hypothetical protein
VYGGDSGYYYVGTYSTRDGQLTGEVKVVKHNPNVPTVWFDNAQEFTVELAGQVTPTGIIGRMARVGMPNLFLPVRLTLKERLP